jgi:hypothetical protein
LVSLPFAIIVFDGGLELTAPRRRRGVLMSVRSRLALSRAWLLSSTVDGGVPSRALE